VTHDRYLVQKTATHLIYLEDGRAHIFDRLSAFEEWLEKGPAEPTPTPAPAPLPVQDAKTGTGTGVALSKNKRDQLEKEVAGLEKEIASVEAEIAALELYFQNPTADTDWETTHRRYSELKETLERLYSKLAARWEIMG
jgi:hypothetical protein